MKSEIEIYPQLFTNILRAWTNFKNLLLLKTLLWEENNTCKQNMQHDTAIKKQLREIRTPKLFYTTRLLQAFAQIRFSYPVVGEQLLAGTR